MEWNLIINLARAAPDEELRARARSAAKMGAQSIKTHNSSSSGGSNNNIGATSGRRARISDGENNAIVARDGGSNQGAQRAARSPPSRHRGRGGSCSICLRAPVAREAARSAAGSAAASLMRASSCRQTAATRALAAPYKQQPQPPPTTMTWLLFASGWRQQYQKSPPLHVPSKSRPVHSARACRPQIRLSIRAGGAIYLHRGSI